MTYNIETILCDGSAIIKHIIVDFEGKIGFIPRGREGVVKPRAKQFIMLLID